MNDDTNPAPQRQRSYKLGAQRLAALFRSFGLLDPGVPVSRRDHLRAADLLLIKHKLGRAYFTRGLSPRTRRARVASLTRGQRYIAQERGWI